MIAPPPRAVRWLERRLHPDERAEILGDLIEQFQHRARTNAPAARRWFWRQALALAWGFSTRRRDVISTAHERTRGWWFLRNAASDWRYAARALVAGRAATIAALLTLTLGLGLSTAVFSVVNSVLVRPLDLPNADRIVRLAEARPTRTATGLGPAVLEASGGSVSDTAIGQFIQTATTMEAVTPFSTTGRNITTARGTEQWTTADVGVRFFDLIGAKPIEGRVFQDDDGRSDAPLVTVISERFWREQLDGRANVAGSVLQIDQQPHTVVGVVSGELRFPEPGIDVWIAGRWRWPAPGARRNFMMWSEGFARLAPGATLDAANIEARAIAARIAAADPAFLDGADVPVPVFRVRALQDDLVAPVKPALVAVAAGMTIVLLAASANLLNLLLARNTARHREMAVRLALGAGRWRVVRPIVFEQILLAAAGVTGGALLAWWLLATLPAFAPASLSRLALVEFDYNSLLFASAIAFTIAVVVGLMPAFQLPRANIRALAAGDAVFAGSGLASGATVRRVLVATEVALAATLLVGAALLGRTLWSLSRVDPGYRPDNAMTFQVGLPDLIFREPARQNAFFEHVLTRLNQHPRVIAAGAASTLPLHEVGLSGSFVIEGRPRPTTPEQWPRADKIGVTPRYFDAIGTRIVRGRAITDADSETSEPVVLINDAVAKLYFADRDPIGQRIDFIRRMFRIVGVVESIKQKSVTAPANTALYFAAAQMPAVLAFNRLSGGIAVRAQGDPLDLVPVIRSLIKEADPTSPMFNVMRLDDRLEATFAEPRFYSLTLGLFAALALLTSILGVYGVLSYSVERRRVEFGVRRALGGSEGHILALVLRQAAGLIAIGLVMGLTLAAFGSGVLRSLLFGVQPGDVGTFAVAAVFIAVVGLAAAAMPALRAIKVDPLKSLRTE